jgi:hypothetical protein
MGYPVNLTGLGFEPLPVAQVAEWLLCISAPGVGSARGSGLKSPFESPEADLDEKSPAGAGPVMSLFEVTPATVS